MLSARSRRCVSGTSGWPGVRSWMPCAGSRWIPEQDRGLDTGDPSRRGQAQRVSIGQAVRPGPKATDPVPRWSTTPWTHERPASSASARSPLRLLACTVALAFTSTPTISSPLVLQHQVDLVATVAAEVVQHGLRLTPSKLLGELTRHEGLEDRPQERPLLLECRGGESGQGQENARIDEMELGRTHQPLAAVGGPGGDEAHQEERLQERQVALERAHRETEGAGQLAVVEEAATASRGETQQAAKRPGVLDVGDVANVPGQQGATSASKKARLRSGRERELPRGSLRAPAVPSRPRRPGRDRGAPREAAGLRRTHGGPPAPPATAARG